MSYDSPDPARRAAPGRYTPRLDTLGQLHVQVLARQVPVTVREISLGGFSLESTETFATGTTHRFRFTLEGGPVVAVLAECVYCTRLPAGGPLRTHRAGFEFVPISEHASEQVASLVYRIAEFWDWQPE